MYFFSECAACGERRIATYSDVASWDSLKKVWRYNSPQKAAICPCKGGVMKYFACENEPYIPNLAVEAEFSKERLAKAGLEIREATDANVIKPSVVVPVGEMPPVREAPRRDNLDPVKVALKQAGTPVTTPEDREGDALVKAWEQHVGRNP